MGRVRKPPVEERAAEHSPAQGRDSLLSGRLGWTKWAKSGPVPSIRSRGALCAWRCCQLDCVDFALSNL